MGHLVRARRWDFTGNAIPSGLPQWPDVPGTTPSRDLRFSYSSGERLIKRVRDENGSDRYDLNVFDTLSLVDTQLDPSGLRYVISRQSQRLRFAGFARVVYAPGLPSPQRRAYRVLLELKDVLGSSVITLDKETSEVTERVNYLPYGGIESYLRSERWLYEPLRPEGVRYTGKSPDAEVGVSNFGARYLSTYLGRWMSPDPLVVIKATDDFNPYSFLGGRLLATVDPHGLQPQCDPETMTCMPDDYITGPGRSPTSSESSPTPETSTEPPAPSAPEGGKSPVTSRPEASREVDPVSAMRPSNDHALSGGYFFVGVLEHKGSFNIEQLGLVGFDRKTGGYVATLTGAGASIGPREFVKAEEWVYNFRTGTRAREELLLTEKQLGAPKGIEAGLGVFVDQEQPNRFGAYLTASKYGITFGGGATFNIDFEAELREDAAEVGVSIVRAPPDIPRSNVSPKIEAWLRLFGINERWLDEEIRSFNNSGLSNVRLTR